MKLELSPEEATQFQYYYPISTVTFYEGAPDIEYLRTRVNAIVEANPWVAGKLVAVGTGLEVKCSDHLSTELFDVIDGTSSGISNESKFSLIREFVRRHVNKTNSGYKCVEFGKQLFQVNLIKLSSGFCIFFTLCHAIGDGHTFYALYRMLDPKVDVISLDYIRNLDFYRNLVKSVGKCKAYFFHSLEIQPFTATADAAIYKLDKEKLDVLKTRFQGDQEFVSTNDIVTSFFFRHFKTDYSHLVINCRNRIEGLNSNLAGNYLYASPFTCHDNITPSSIRQSILDFGKPSANIHQKSDGQSSVSLLSSWTRLYHHLEFEGCRLKLHLPLALHDENPLTDGLGITFMIDKDTIGLLVEANVEVIEGFNEVIEEIGSLM